MTYSSEDFQSLKSIYPSVKEVRDGNHPYLHFPEMKVRSDGEFVQVSALLDCFTNPTKLFLSKHFLGKGANWSTSVIIGCEWHTFSYEGVSNSLSLISILANHLDVLR